VAMLDHFWITHEIDQIDCDLPTTDDFPIEAFLLHVVTGTAIIGYGQQSVSIPACGLLQLSSSLTGLVTFPAMYRLEGFAHAIETEFDFRSYLDNDNIVITIFRGPTQRLSFAVSITSALQTVGPFHREVLSKWLKACPTLWNHGVLLTKIPYAFGLSLTLGKDL
jgi:hypothetical protein